MKNKIVKFAIITFSTVLFSPSLFARGESAGSSGFLLEPYVGYSTGSWTCGSSGGCSSSTTVTVSGVTFGGRLGYELNGFLFGADYTSGSWSDSYNGISDKYTPSDIGIFIGYDSGTWFRGFVTYNVSSSLSDSATQGGASASLTATGTGFKVGLGYRVLPYLSVNLEYLSDVYTKEKQNGNTTSLSPSVTYGLFGLSVSFPFMF